MQELLKTIPDVETRPFCYLSVNQLIYLHYIGQEIGDHLVKQEISVRMLNQLCTTELGNLSKKVNQLCTTELERKLKWWPRQLGLPSDSVWPKSSWAFRFNRLKCTVRKEILMSLTFLAFF